MIKAQTPEDRRAAYCSGLAELASFLADHPEVPIAPHANGRVFSFAHSDEELRTAAGVMAPFDKEYDEQYITLLKWFGPWCLEVSVKREHSCTRKVVGTETVTESVLVSHAQYEEREVTRDAWEWDCPESILRLDGGTR